MSAKRTAGLLGSPLVVVLVVVVMMVGCCLAIPPPNGKAPPDWAQRVAQGSMLYTAQEPRLQDLQGSVGNGYLGTIIGNPALYISGVFNRLYWHPQPPDPSRRTRMPTTTNVTVTNATAYASALDLGRGIFYRRSSINYALDDGASCLVLVEQRWYAHRKYWSLMMHEIEVDTSRCSSSSGNMKLSITESDGGPTTDVSFRLVESSLVEDSNDVGYQIFQGATVRPEIDSGTTVKIAYTRWNADATSFDVPLGESSTVIYLPTTYRTSLDTAPEPLCPDSFNDIDNCGSPGISLGACTAVGCCFVGSKDLCLFNVDVQSASKNDYLTAVNNTETLLTSHIREWETLLAAGIDIAGDVQLASVVNASYYYILSSIRDGWPYSVSPGGIVTGGGNASYYPQEEQMGYFGHTFWDADIFVMPSLLPLYPKLAAMILEYRYDRIDMSKLVAQSYGNEGTKFAWESAFTGAEENRHPNDEDHLTPDIAIASRQYFRATGDLKWLSKIGMPLLTGIAEYLWSRATLVAGPPPPGGFTLAQLKAEKNGAEASNYYFSILNVQPPNEYADHVNNSIYMNVVTSMALQWTLEAAALVNYEFPNNEGQQYLNLSENLYFPFDEKHMMHLGYENERYGFPVKQADVTLLNYPLQFPMSEVVRKNDLVYEVNFTNSNGPAMTHAIFSIGWLQVGNPEEAETEFLKSYQLYVRPPFNTWIECPDPGCVNDGAKRLIGNAGPAVPPCANFITGAGGFLQSVIYGYLGLRYNTDNFTINPTIPTNVTSLTARQLNYLGNLLDIQCTSTKTVITVTQQVAIVLAVLDSNDHLVFLQPQVPTSFMPGRLQIIADTNGGGDLLGGKPPLAKLLFSSQQRT